MTELISKYLNNINDKINNKTQNWSTRKKLITIGCFVVAILMLSIYMISGVSLPSINIFKGRYVEFSSAEIKKLDCDELIKKNAGKKRQFCGYVGGGFITVYKQDLYNSWPKHCYNSMKLPDDEYCYLFFGQYDNSRFYGYPEGMYSFSAELSSDCSYEYYNRDYTFANYCLKRPTNIKPADNKTKAKLGVY